MNQEDNSQGSLSPVTDSDGIGSIGIMKEIVPFEDPSKDFFSGLLETIKLVLFKPTHFFRDYKLDGTMGKPIVFAVIVGWVSSFISLVWGLIISESIYSLLDPIIERLPQIEGFEWEQFQSANSNGGMFDFVFSVVMAPLFILIFLFISAGIFHLFLLIVKGTKKNFETTFNVVAYGMAAQLIQLIPFCGSLISGIYGLVLSIIGLTEAHETESWKAVFAVLAPMILCCVCCLMLIMILGGTGALIPIIEKIPWN